MQKFTFDIRGLLRSCSRKPLYLVLAFTIIVVSIISIGFIRSAFAADTVGVEELQASWHKHSSVTESCISYAPRAEPDRSGWVRPGEEAVTGFGPKQSDCATASQQSQSVVGFTPSSNGQVRVGVDFELGVLQHRNNTIPQEKSSIDHSGVLSLRIAGKNFDFGWNMTESANECEPKDCADDHFAFTSQSSPTITVNKMPYSLVIKGFKDPSGAVKNDLQSKENTTTRASIIATFAQVRNLSFTSTISHAPTGWSGATDLGFAIESNLAGSDWRRKFDLHAANTQGSTYSVEGPGRVVAGVENIAVTQVQVPAGIDMSAVNCVDAQGRAAADVQLEGNKASLRLKPASRPELLAVTCTVQNAPPVLPLSISATAATELTREYPWQLRTQLVPGGDIYTDRDKPANFTHLVIVEAKPALDKNFVVRGKATITNPNQGIAFAQVQLSIDQGCRVEGYNPLQPVTIPGAGSVSFDYLCEKANNAPGMINISASWSGLNARTNGSTVTSSNSQTPYDFSTAAVRDGLGKAASIAADKPGFGAKKTVEWDKVIAEPNRRAVFSFEETVPAKNGSCTPVVNAATLTGSPQGEQRQSAQARLCHESGTSLIKEIKTKFFKTQGWSLDADVINSSLNPITGEATAEVKIRTTELDPRKDAYVISAVALVENSSDEIKKISTMQPSITQFNGADPNPSPIGISCVAANPPRVIPAKSTASMSFVCTFPDSFSMQGKGKLGGQGSLAATLVDSDGKTITVERQFGFELSQNQTTQQASVSAAGKQWTYSVQGPGTIHEESVLLSKQLNQDSCAMLDVEIGLNAQRYSVAKQICHDHAPAITFVPATYSRDYEWKLSKTVDNTKSITKGQDSAVFNYSVVAEVTSHRDTVNTPGKIIIENFEDVEVKSSLEFSSSPGLSCVASQAAVTLGKRGSATARAEVQANCQGEIAQKSLVVSVSTTKPDGTTSLSSGQIRFNLIKSLNSEVTILDDKTAATLQPLTKVKVAESGKKIDYKISLQAPAGSCQKFVSKTQLQEKPATLADPLSVEVCAIKSADVSLTARGSYQRDYVWKFDKQADHSSPIIVKSGSQRFINHKLTAHAERIIDSQKLVTGTMVVSNPNAFQPVRVTGFHDVFAGSNCVLAEQLPLSVESQLTLHYACKDPQLAPTDYGNKQVNVATLIIDGSEVVSDAVPVLFSAAATRNEIAVINDISKEFDQKYSLAERTVSFTAIGQGQNKTFEFSQPLPAPTGACTTLDSKSWLKPTDSESMEQKNSLEVCGDNDLSIAKSVTANLKRTYGWKLSKDPVGTPTLNANGQAILTYDITTTELAAADSAWNLSGIIKVANGNDHQITVTITDSPGLPGVQCRVPKGDQVTIPAKTLVPIEFEYSCTFPSQYSGPTKGTNIALIEWKDRSGQIRTDRAAQPFDLNVAAFQQTVTVNDSNAAKDSQGKSSWNYTWSSVGTVHKERVSVLAELPAGGCQAFTGSASLTSGERKIVPDAVTPAQNVCRKAALGIQTRDGSFKRTYQWNLEKTLDKTQLWVGDVSQPVQVQGKIKAIPNGYLDAFKSAGEILLINPNSFTSMQASVTLQSSPGLSCRIYDGQLLVTGPVRVNADSRKSLSVQCSDVGIADQKIIALSIIPADVGGINPQPAVENTIKLNSAEVKNQQVAVRDSKTSKPDVGVANWTAGEQTFATSSQLLGAVTGKCQAIAVDAWLNLAPISDADSELQSTLRADQKVTVCHAQPVSESIKAGFERDYQWGLSSRPDQDRYDVSGAAKVRIGYTTVVQAKSYQDSKHNLTGSFHVTNPSRSGIAMTPKAVFAKNNCEISPSSVTVRADASQLFTYTCPTTDLSPEGYSANKIEVSLTLDNQGTNVVSGFSQPVRFEPSSKINETLNLVDSSFDVKKLEGGNSFTWEQGLRKEIKRTAEYNAEPGKCIPIETETALTGILPNPSVTKTSTKICSDQAVPVIKDHSAALSRTYGWQINKKLTGTKVDRSTGLATLTYDIIATEQAPQQSQLAYDGALVVTNPLDKPIKITVSDDAGLPGTTCKATTRKQNLPATDLQLEPGQDIELRLACEFGQKYSGVTQGSNKATVMWTDATGVSRTDVATKKINVIDVNFAKNVLLKDNGLAKDREGKTEWSYSWSKEGTQHVASVTWEPANPVSAGQCDFYASSVTLAIPGGTQVSHGTLPEKICRSGDIQASHTASGKFDRTYRWGLEQTATPSGLINIPLGQSKEVTTTVTAKATGYTDANLRVTGQIEIKNPNIFQPITISEFKDQFGGRNCILGEKLPIKIEVGKTAVLHYACTDVSVAEQDYRDNTKNQATLVIDGRPVVLQAEPMQFVPDKKINEQAMVSVNGTAVAEALTWAQGLTKTLSNPTTVKPLDHKCDVVEKVAKLDSSGQQLAQDSLRVTVCTAAEQKVLKGVDTSFVKTTGWGFSSNLIAAKTDSAGRPELKYQLVTTEGERKKSYYSLTGSIRLLNSSIKAQPFTVSIQSHIPGLAEAACQVDGGHVVLLTPGELRPVGYSCIVPDDYNAKPGHNTIDVAWLDPMTGKPRSESTTVEAAASPSEFASTASVVDLSLGKVISTYPWSDRGKDHVETVEWRPDVIIPAGSCRTFTHQASLSIQGKQASSMLHNTVCHNQDLLVDDATINGSFARKFEWDLSSRVDKPTITTDKRKVTFVVDALGTHHSDSDHELKGTVSITNPVKEEGNSAKQVKASIGGFASASCTIDGATTVPLFAGRSHTFSFHCDPQALARLTPNRLVGPISSSIAMDFTFAGGKGVIHKDLPVSLLEIPTNKTINLADSTIDLQRIPGSNQVSWPGGSVSYEKEISAEPGTCSAIPTTVQILSTGQATSQAVQVCLPSDPKVAVSAIGTVDRIYDWKLEKKMPASPVNAVSGSTATLDYVVSARAAGFSDSGHRLSGVIDVENPNDFTAMTINSANIDYAGSTCLVDTALPLEIKPAAKSSIKYSCHSPAVVLDDTQIMPKATATIVVNGSQLLPIQTHVDFKAIKEINKSVSLYDSLHEVSESKLEWKPGAVYNFPYTKAVPVPVGSCTQIDSKTTLKVAQSDLSEPISATTTVCGHGEQSLLRRNDATFTRSQGWQLDHQLVEAKLSAEGNPTIVSKIVASELAEDAVSQKLQGMIELTNPTDETINVTVTDKVKIAGLAEDSCQVAHGKDQSILAGQTRRFRFDCFVPADFVGEMVGTHQVFISGSNQTDPKSKEPRTPIKEAWSAPIQSTKIPFDRSVTVKDDQTTQTFPAYAWEKPGNKHEQLITWQPNIVVEPGQCQTFNHPTKLITSKGQIVDEISATLCRGKQKTLPDFSPVADLKASGSFERDYQWQISKQADRTSAVSGENVTYTVDVSGKAVKDSKHRLDGVFTLKNPLPTMRDLTFDAQLAGFDNVHCAVNGGSSVKLKPGSMQTLNFSCDPQTLARYTAQLVQGQVQQSITLTLTWRDDAAASGQVDIGIPVTLEEHALHQQISVKDNHVDLENLPGGNVLHWSKKTKQFVYTKTLTGSKGSTVTNQVSIPQTGQKAEAKVKIS